MSEHNTCLKDLTEAEYRASEHIAASDIRWLMKSPAHFRAYKDGKIEEESDALSLGTMIHAAILTPDQWKDSYNVKPAGMNFSTKEGKNWKEEHAGKQIITAEQYETLNRCVESVHKHDIASALLTGYREQSCLVEDANGNKRKSRFDCISFSGGFLPDLKCVKDASEEAFSRAIDKWGWDVRGAFYLDNAEIAEIRKDGYVFIAVETAPPYVCACWLMNAMVAEWGRRQYQAALQVHRNCLETGRWPGYHKGVAEIGLPEYKMRMLDKIL